ncbi:MAG TPA: hypothetical protein VLX28_24005 [Thermoanaerobaculia bacterium]|nr:hypothetical protein [Thermoanaerobaculia bacterium]
MRKANVFGAKSTNWALVSTNLKPHLADMPQVQPLQAELEALIGEAHDVDGRQELARGQARDLTHQRQDIEKRGEDLRRRIASHLRGTFGFTSEQLVQFGVNPRPRVTRRKKTTETPAPVPTPTPTAK